MSKEQLKRKAELLAAITKLISEINRLVPNSDEREIALSKVAEASTWCIDAISSE